MTYKTIIGLLVLLCLATNQSVAQTSDRFVKVGDTTVNLRDVDLEKGLVLFKNTDVKGQNGSIVDIEQRLFRSPDNNSYLKVTDSSYVIGYGGMYSSRFTYYNKNGKELFSKSFKDLGVFKVLISKNGNSVLVDLYSEDQSKFVIINNQGIIIKEIKNKEVYVTTDVNHSTFYLQEDEKYNEILILNLDEGIEKLLVFNERVYRGGISPSGEYFTPRSGDSLMVFDRYGNYQWGLKYEKQSIYVFANGKKYYVNYPFPIGRLEVKESANHTLLYSINRVYYNGKDYPVYKSGVVNDTEVIWVSYNVDDIQVFNFIDINGEIINIDTVPSNIGIYQISFAIDNGIYRVIY